MFKLFSVDYVLARLSQYTQNSFVDRVVSLRVSWLIAKLAEEDLNTDAYGKRALCCRLLWYRARAASACVAELIKLDLANISVAAVGFRQLHFLGLIIRRQARNVDSELLWKILESRCLGLSYHPSLRKHLLCALGRVGNFKDITRLSRYAGAVLLIRYPATDRAELSNLHLTDGQQIRLIQERIRRKKPYIRLVGT